MNLSKKSLLSVFLTCLTLSLTLPIFIPTFRINLFPAFLIILFYRRPFIVCLWAAAGCGIFLDLLSPHARLGLHAVSFTVATVMLYQQRRNFFADSPSTLPIMTFLFSMLSSILQWILLPAFDKGIAFTMEWFIKDLIVMPAADAITATAIFIAPFYFFGSPVRKGKDYFTG